MKDEELQQIEKEIREDIDRIIGPSLKRGRTPNECFWICYYCWEQMVKDAKIVGRHVIEKHPEEFKKLLVGTSIFDLVPEPPE